MRATKATTKVYIWSKSQMHKNKTQLAAAVSIIKGDTLRIHGFSLIVLSHFSPPSMAVASPRDLIAHLTHLRQH